MIRLTRRDGRPIVLNAEEIVWIEELAETIITLRDGNKLFVRDRTEDIVRRFIYYKQQIHNPQWAQSLDTPLKE